MYSCFHFEMKLTAWQYKISALHDSTRYLVCEFFFLYVCVCVCARVSAYMQLCVRVRACVRLCVCVSVRVNTKRNVKKRRKNGRLTFKELRCSVWYISPGDCRDVVRTFNLCRPIHFSYWRLYPFPPMQMEVDGTCNSEAKSSYLFGNGADEQCVINNYLFIFWLMIPPLSVFFIMVHG